MKYLSFKPSKSGILNIRPPIKGINNYEAAENIDPLEAVRLNNVIIENGCIKNRKGLASKLENIFDLSDFNSILNAEFTVTDFEMQIDGKVGRIAVAYIVNDDSTHIYRMFFAHGDATYRKFGDIYFNRTTDSVFYIPSKIVFLKGKPQKGGGIFAFVKLANMYDTSATETRIYEIDNEYSSWMFYGTNYIPTVYINGRGNRYEEAKANDTAYTGSPKSLETLNLIDGHFHSYYTSDGFSNLFRLPYSNLENKSVLCKLYSSATNYFEWIIYEDTTSSDGVTIDGKNVIMYVDRPKGIVYFKCENEDYSLPYMILYPQNNICFTASKSTDYTIDDIVSCKIAVSSGNKVFLAGGDRQSEIFVCDRDNPYYFPQCFNNLVGNDLGEVTAMCSTGDGVYVFKEKGIYIAKLKGEKILNKISLLSDESTYFKDLGDFQITKISNNWGCINSATLKVVGNCPVWFSKSGEVCTIKNNVVKILSQKIDKNSLEVFKEDITSAFVSGDNYILTNKNNAFVMNLKDDISASYFWEFPENIKILGGVSDRENTSFVFNTISSDVFCIANLSEDEDIIINKDLESEKYPIEKNIATKRFLGEKGDKNRINRVTLNCKNDRELRLEVGDDFNKQKFFLPQNDFDKEKETDVLVGSYGIKSVGISLKTEGKITFSGARIFYS